MGDEIHRLEACTMGDEIHRLALLRGLPPRLGQFNYDELCAIDVLVQRVELGRERYGELDLDAPRDWRAERFRSREEALLHDVYEELALERAARADLHEAARNELLAEWQDPAEHETRVSDESARIATEDPRAIERPYLDFDVRDVGAGEGC